jgi:hypothetical protein
VTYSAAIAAIAFSRIDRSIGMCSPRRSRSDLSSRSFTIVSPCASEGNPRRSFFQDGLGSNTKSSSWYLSRRLGARVLVLRVFHCRVVTTTALGHGHCLLVLPGFVAMATTTTQRVRGYTHRTTAQHTHTHNHTHTHTITLFPFPL